MNIKDIIAQGFGVLGLIIIVLSFQAKENKKFFILQGLGSLMFVINFLMIGAIAGALFNLTNTVRGALFSKDDKKKWKLLVVEALYAGCFVFSVFMAKGDFSQIILASLPCAALLLMSVFMWKGNPRHIRYSQIIYMSPAWIIHNIFNFTLGGLLCETFNMISAFIAIKRYKG